MSDVAIRVENLSKQYQIGTLSGHRSFDNHSLRDTLAGAFSSPFRRASALLRGQAYGASEMNETFWALKNVSFEVKRGEVVGIIGRNGAGKSTLLKILSHITEPTEGQVTIYGRVGSLLEVGTGFHPELTGRENIYLNGAILGMKRVQIERQFDEIVAFAGVEKFIDTPVKHYSSGMYLRLAFAVAAHLEPEILIVDEVLAVGDIEFQKKCLGKMQDVAGQGRTILFVSHNMTAIRRLCQNGIWLENGRKIKSGRAREIVGAYEGQMMTIVNESSTVAERVQKQAQGLNFYFKRVEILDVHRQPTNKFKYGDMLLLNVEMAGKLDGDVFSPEFYLYNEAGILISVGASGHYHDKFFSHRVKRIRIEIGPLLITSGKYAISLSVMAAKGRIDTWEQAIVFTITECSPFERLVDIPAHREGVCVHQHSFTEIG